MVFLRFVMTVLLAFQGVFAFSQDYSKIVKAFEKSYMLEEQKKYAEAINEIKTVYEDKSYEANLRLAWLLYKSNQAAESVIYYEKAIELMPYAIEAHWGIVYPLDILKRTEKIMFHYQKILEICPDNSVALYKMGIIYYYKKEYLVADKYFDKVVNLYPFDYDGLVMSAWTKFQLKNVREASILFNKALMRNPSGESALEGKKLLGLK